MSGSDGNIVNQLTSFQKLGISLATGIVAYFLFLLVPARTLPHLIFGWDVFTLTLIVLTWITFYTTSPEAIRKQAQRQDDRGPTMSVIVLIAACISMLAVIMLLVSKTEAVPAKVLHLSLGVACMVLSWIIVHTIFASHYAHLYYADGDDDAFGGGLDFPEEKKPDYMDFAYFSFTVGMTFQVSDVEISNRKIRRLALLHSLLSFGYNATIIALMVNIIAGLTQ